MDELPIAARDISALMSLGLLHAVGSNPLTVVSLVRGVGGSDSIWIDLGYPSANYADLWRVVYPDEMIPATCEAKPLLSPEEARRGGFGLVRLGLVCIGGVADRFDGKYLIKGVTHKYEHESDNGGYTTSDGRFRYRS